MSTRPQPTAPGSSVILLTGCDVMMAEGKRPEAVALVLGKPASLADLRRALPVVTCPPSALSGAPVPHVM